jgi:hypothetical protein
MCFPWASIEAIIIWCIVIAAVFAIIRILLGWLGPKIGIAAEILGIFMQIFYVILWAVIAIAIVVVVGDIIGCLIGMAPSLGLHSR